MAGGNKRIQRTKNRFSEVPKAQISRSTFNRSHGHKTTFDAGFLRPMFVDDALPGDTYTMSLNAFARLATPLHPTMDNLYLDTFFFFVPNRLVWTNWQKQMGEQDQPGDSTDFTTPQVIITEADWDADPVFDYMGIPRPSSGQDIRVSALPFRALHLIWNEHFRDQNLQGSITVPTDDGPDLGSVYTRNLQRGKRHDYFTSSLPWPQKGDAVALPLGDYANVNSNVTIGADGLPKYGASSTGLEAVVGSGSPVITKAAPSWAGGDLTWSDPALVADMSTVTGATINQLRQAFQVQKLLERDARGGTRYTEVIKAHFGVTSPDARLQRPEILSTGSSFIQINPVAQTSATSSDVFVNNTPQANLAAVGTGSISGHGFHKSFTEHGYVIGLVSARADLTYQQGIERHWSRQTRLDHFWPALQHIGEQAVLQKEILAKGDNANDNLVWGYQERYAEYRYKPSRVSGLFRSGVAGSLDSWHYAQELVNPVLNAQFIAENPPIDRTIAVPSEPHFLLDMWFNLKCARPMPVYGVPGLIDHF